MRRRSFFGAIAAAFAGAKLAKALAPPSPTNLAVSEVILSTKSELRDDHWSLEISMTIPDGVESVDIYLSPWSDGKARLIGKITRGRSSDVYRLGPFERPMETSQLFFVSVACNEKEWSHGAAKVGEFVVEPPKFKRPTYGSIEEYEPHSITVKDKDGNLRRLPFA